MASILSGNSLPSNQAQPQDPVAAANALVQQIMSSENPTETFNQIVNQSPEARNAVDLAKQYGNGQFNKETFMRIAAAQGKQALAMQIMQRMGLG